MSIFDPIRSMTVEYGGSNGCLILEQYDSDLYVNYSNAFCKTSLRMKLDEAIDIEDNYIFLPHGSIRYNDGVMEYIAGNEEAPESHSMLELPCSDTQKDDIFHFIQICIDNRSEKRTTSDDDDDDDDDDETVGTDEDSDTFDQAEKKL